MTILKKIKKKFAELKPKITGWLRKLPEVIHNLKDKLIEYLYSERFLDDLYYFLWTLWIFLAIYELIDTFMIWYQTYTRELQFAELIEMLARVKAEKIQLQELRELQRSMTPEEFALKDISETITYDAPQEIDSSKDFYDNSSKKW